MTAPLTADPLDPLVTAIEILPEQDTTERSVGFDLAAPLLIAVIIVLYHVLVPGLRTDSPTGIAFKSDSLRRVVAIILGFLVVYMYSAEGAFHPLSAIRRVAGAILALYTVYVVSFVFFGLELATDSILPSLAELAALVSVIALWQPWTRVDLYRKQAKLLFPPLAIVTVLLVAWELIVRAFDIQRFLLPAPSVIVTTFVSKYPVLIGQGWFTLQNAIWGVVLGCGAGILFGLSSARFIRFNRALMPYAIAVNSIPIIAFAPITNAWFGVLNPMSKITIVAILTFFPAMINTVKGLTSTDPASLELMRSLAANEFTIFRTLRIPAALPYIFNGLKTATSLSMIGAIVAEYFGGLTTGLGVQISDNAMMMRFPLVWSQIIIASVLGITFYFVVSLAERLFMPWHVSFREKAE